MPSARQTISVLLVLAQISFGALADKPEVISIEPNEASYMGGTRLFIRGKGFSSGGNFNTAEGRDSVGNKAFLVSDAEKVPCEVENDASHETMIVCYTKPMKSGAHYYVQVEVDGVPVPMEENCRNRPRSSLCRFIPRWWLTPYLGECHVTEDGADYPIQNSHVPGSLVTCSGRIFTQIYGSNDQFNENGRSVSIRRAYAGGMKCDLLNGTVPYGLTLTSGDEGSFTCKTEGTFVGAQNVSLLLTDNYGRTDIDKSVYKTNSKDKVYHFQTYAEITGISPHAGSLEGGTRLLIHGNNFDDTTEPVQIFVGGVPCTVVPGTRTDNTVECITGPPPAPREYYTGSRGIVFETWRETTTDDDDDSLSLDENSANYQGPMVLDSTGYKWNDDEDNFVAKYTGVFVAPKTDRYKFQMAADDRASLYVNCEGLTDDLERVAYRTQPGSHFSEWRELSEGQECYFIAILQEYSGSAYMHVGVQRATTTLTATQSIDAKNEKQIIDFSASFLREKQEINLANWSSPGGVAEEQKINVSHPCISTSNCNNVGYRLRYEGVTTHFIEANAMASTVRSRLAEIFELSDEDLEVSANDAEGDEMVYTVRFNGKRGDYSSLTFDKYPNDATGPTITIEETVKGSADMTSFKLRLGGRATKPIAADAGVEDIQEALNGTLDAHCPSFILPDKRKSTVITTIDYETEKYGDEWGTRTRDVEAFCGRTSIRNIGYVYFAGRTADNEKHRHEAFDASTFRWLCLAHRGIMYEYLHLTGTFEGTVTKRTGTYSFSNPLAMHETEWRYSCIDLLKMVRSHSAFSDVNDVELSIIRFLRKGRDYSYYIDALTIGSDETTIDYDGILGLRTPPALANGEPLDWISVEEGDEVGKYEIEIDPYNCGNQLPLITTSTATNGWDTTRLVSGSAPMSGQFDLTVNFYDGRSYNITNIEVNITTEKFAELLEQDAPGFGQANVWLGGGCHARDYGIEWLTNGGDKPMMELHPHSIDGGPSEITSRIYTAQDGGIFHKPMTGDMIRMAFNQPQVEVMINGYPSKCSGDCHFMTSSDATPLVTGISPTSGSAGLHTSITISGSNMNSEGTTPTTVTIGEAECSVTTSSENEIICKLGDGPLGTYDVILNVGGKGIARKNSESVSMTFEISGGITSITPEYGFSSGGTEVTIEGYGFSDGTDFSIGSVPCKVQSLSSTEATCTTGANSVGSVSVSAVDGNVDLESSESFEYQETNAIVFSVHPVTASVTGGELLTLNTTGITEDDVQVLVGTESCEKANISDGQITCMTPSLSPGEYSVKVIISNRGLADTTTHNVADILYALEVNSISPEHASFNGGTKIEITGHGFDDADIEVKFGDSTCEIDSISSETIICTTSSFTKVHRVTNQGRHQTQGDGFAWQPLNLDINVGDTVLWEWKFEGAPGGWEYGARVFTTDSATSDAYDEVGFQSSTEKSEEGLYAYTFNNEGTFYISSGDVDHPYWGSVVMRQSIVVRPALAASHILKLTVNGHEALYERDESSSPVEPSSEGSCEEVVSSTYDGCVPYEGENDLDGFFVTTDSCYSPIIESISPNEGTTATTINITGSGFGALDCMNKVLIGDYECQVLSSSRTNITCKPSPNENTAINVAFQVKVNVDNIGDTIAEIKQENSRRFALLPSMSSISPTSGSLEGGTKIKIEGSGFSPNLAEVAVTIGYVACEVVSSSFFEIECISPSSQSSEQEVKVYVNGQDVQCTGACLFEYSMSATPTITGFSPTSVNSPDARLQIEGTNFTANANLISVIIGEKNCQVETASDRVIVCVIGELPAGFHTLQLTIYGKGLAQFDIESPPAGISSSADITDMTPTAGSMAGGTELTFKGNGFNAEDLQVKVGNTLCSLVEGSVTNSEFKCITSENSVGVKKVTVTANEVTFGPKNFTYAEDLTPTITSISPSSGQAPAIVVINGTKFSPNEMTLKIGNSECLNIEGGSGSITCELQEHGGGDYPVTAIVEGLGSAQSNVTFTYLLTMTSVTPKNGSHAGGDNVTISGQGLSKAAVVKICDKLCEHESDTSNQLTCKVPSSGSDNITKDKVCAIEASVNGQPIPGEFTYTYAKEKTPIVTRISPLRGGTQGGTLVTISGQLFDSDTEKVSVKIGGVDCDIESSSTTEIQCTTNSTGQSVKAPVEVHINGKGWAISQGVEFHYVDVWSSDWTWGGRPPPVDGDFVVVPTGQTVLIDVDTPLLKMLLINGGGVIFDEKDIHLQAENILITDGGFLRIGTEEEPFEHNAVITMHGDLRSPELPIYGTKTIGVRNGTLDFHGRHVPHTWTHLGQTAEAGSSQIVLKEKVTWEAGNEIVIATTGDRHSQSETETATIESISADGLTLTLTKSLQYTHISTEEQFDGVLLETRAEVGLLTRNIVVQGSKDIDWSNTIPACEDGFDTGEFVTQTCFQGRFGEEEGSDQFGAQIMIHHRAPDLDIARARLEYVELRNVGQAFRLGRYPIHFHLLGDVNFNNYVRGCAIHRSFNRAITIHNTHHLLIERNVIYDIMGGAVFIEDGIEHGNMIQHNLVLFCKQSTSLQNDDITPAAFWVTNPNNTLQHNAAAGGTHFGFWYRIHETPDGPSKDESICQQLHPVQKFQNNTVHSQGWFGLWVFQRYTPRGDGSCGSTSPTVAEYHSLTVWNCEKGAELVDVGAIKFYDFVMAHNSKAGIETKLVVDSKVRWGQVGTYNSFIIAHAQALTEGRSTARGMILPFTEAYEVENTKFINFDESGTAAIGVTSIDGTCTFDCGGWEARFRNTSFQNSPNKAAFRWEHEVSLRDMDGTLTGNNQTSVIVPTNPTISPSECPKAEGFDIGSFDGLICDGSKKFHRVSWNNVRPTSLEAKDVIFSTKSGQSFIPFNKKRLTHKFGWMGTMNDGETYGWTFQDADHITNISYDAGFYNFEENDCVIVAHNLTQQPDVVKIEDAVIEEAKKDEMVNCDENYHGDYYFDTNEKTLYYIVSGRNGPSRKKRFVTDAATEGAINREVNFEAYRCFYEDCIPPPDPNSQPPVRVRDSEFQIWHDHQYWSINEDNEYVGNVSGDVGHYPPALQDVRITSGAWIVVNQPLNKLNKLWIEGVLEIEFNDTSLDVTLSATHIIILGGRLIVGWPDATFQGMANIVLRGDHNTEGLVMEGGVNLGAKSIGVTGGLDLHGRERSLRTTHLLEPLEAGENSITVVDSPSDWAEGEEIVIATTSADPWETETFKIEAVNGKTITLNATAKFTHIADTFSYGDEATVESYDIRAEVSMLSRNIKIIGEDYSDLFSESFGARVLVAGVGSGRGYARIQNVEFYHTGQEGFIDNYDPRYSLAFLDTGTVDSVKPSVVKRNTFHNGFNTAIGVFGASGLQVTENTIHHTVGPAIRVEGDNITLDRNLVMLARTRSVYQDRTESDLLLWKAAIEVNLANSPMLTGNVVVGSERAGYRIDGHDCSDSSSEVEEWGWNTARATLQGVFLNKDGYTTCTHFGKFRIHNAYDNGVYCQVEGSVKMSNILITDSNFGFSAIIYGPESKRHEMHEKQVTIEDSVVVAVSKSGYCPTLNDNADYLVNAPNARPLPRTGAGKSTRAGILWPAFISGHNAAPSKPFLGSLSYPAIAGKTILNNLTFVNFGDTSCSPDHSVFLTNLKIEDFLHPIETSNLRFIESPESTYIYFHRPSLEAINPSDCVDMECDGMKKALIVDKDGSMLGSPDSSAFPQAEFEWDGDSRRGLGDYRIPKTLLTDQDGNKVEASDLVPNKGIVRKNCTEMTAWNGYKCSGLHYSILVVENLDADTETRRLSPVALKVDNFIDLNNGPQDHGWCSGYTCQERLSTFWVVVATNETYDFHFSGTAPQKLRLRLLNEDRPTAMVLRIYYSRPQRMDVYVASTLQRPLNFALSEDGEESVLPESYSGQYFPTLYNSTGANFHDRSHQTVHVTLRGGNNAVDIHEALVVVISFRLPAVSPDEFFDNGALVNNLAIFLNIPIYKIRLVNVVREQSSRRRRDTAGTYTATAEIGDPPEETLDTTSTATASPVTGGATTASSSSATTTEELENVTTTITNALQQGALSEAIGTAVTSITVVEPRAAAVRQVNFSDSTPDNLERVYEYYTPVGLRIVQQPNSGKAGSSLSPVLTVTGIEENGTDIILGRSSDRWHATVTVLGGEESALLSGTSITVFDDDGYAIFNNLAISLPGSYVLRVSVTYPEGQSALTVITLPFTLEDSTESSGNGDLSNLAVVVTCAVVGGLLLIAIVATLIVKSPYSQNARSSSKVSRTDVRPWNSPPPYDQPGRPPSSTAASNRHFNAESQHPHAVMDETKRPLPF